MDHLKFYKKDIKEGIDVSQWQGNIDFVKVKETGIHLVYIKASEGRDFVDPYFKIHYKKAIEAGLSVGFYHFLTAKSVKEARQEAIFFLSVIKGKRFDLRLAMDFETTNGLSITQVRKIAAAFLKYLMKHCSKKPIVYSDLSMVLEYGDSLIGYPLWIARYRNEIPDKNGKWKEWTGWQYESNGRVDGIKSYVDKDRFTKNIYLDSRETIKNANSIPKKGADEILYTVKVNDTLSEIARRFGTTVEAIVSRNGIVNPNRIYPGQELLIVKKSTVPYVFYRIRTKDTLSSIARRFHTSVSNLVKWNHINDPNLIYPGQMLKIYR